jgi:hypothetical protein
MMMTLTTIISTPTKRKKNVVSLNYTVRLMPQMTLKNVNAIIIMILLH